jgi:fused signal recognition particle receptor
MDELGKIGRTLGKAQPGAPHEVWQIIDASIGSNAICQAREFSKTTPLTGLVITKLDGTGRGGSLVPICRELAVPVRFAGLGEQMHDLQPFRADFFAQALFEAKE